MRAKPAQACHFSAPDVNGREIQTIEIQCATLMIAKSAARAGENGRAVGKGCERMWWESWQTMRESDAGESRRDSI
jgi:hypothetical protein